MKINFYNKKESKIDFARELLSYRPNLLIADSIRYDSLSSNDIINYLLLDDNDDETTLRLMATYYNNSTEFPGRSETLIKFADGLKLLTKVKHKTKEHLVLIGKTKMLAKESKKILKAACEEYLSKQNLLELIQFAEEEILILNAINYFENDGKENLYIKQFIININDKASLFCLDQNVEELYRFCHLGVNDYQSCDFIKIPLWKFPLMADMTYARLKHTREHLAPVLFPFKEQCKELNEKLSTLPFIKANWEEILNYPLP